MNTTEYIVNHTTFLASIDQRTNTVCVRSCHPYDDQHYHWARRSERTGNWLIFRNGKTISCESKTVTEEQIANILSNLDRNLKPIMCYD